MRNDTRPSKPLQGRLYTKIPGPLAHVTFTSHPVSLQPLTLLIINFFYYKIVNTFKVKQPIIFSKVVSTGSKGLDVPSVPSVPSVPNKVFRILLWQVQGSN